jgi:hypothetical protein
MNIRKKRHGMEWKKNELNFSLNCILGTIHPGGFSTRHF